MVSYRFKDKAIYGYGTSIPPNNNEDEESELPPRKVIFCVHGKLSGCCTVVKGSVDDNNTTTDYQQNPISMFPRGSTGLMYLIFNRKLWEEIDFDNFYN